MLHQLSHSKLNFKSNLVFLLYSLFVLSFFLKYPSTSFLENSITQLKKKVNKSRILNSRSKKMSHIEEEFHEIESQRGWNTIFHVSFTYLVY